MYPRRVFPSCLSPLILVLPVLVAGCAQVEQTAPAPADKAKNEVGATKGLDSTNASSNTNVPSNTQVPAKSDTTAVDRSHPLALGKMAPPFFLKRLGGGRIALNSLRGQVVVLSFWTPTCPPCHSEAPHLQRLHQKYRSQGVRFVGIAPLTSTAEMHAFVKTHGLTYDIAVDVSEKTAIGYGLAGYPATYLIDRKGAVRFFMLGYRAGDERVLEAKIRSLL